MDTTDIFHITCFYANKKKRKHYTFFFFIPVGTLLYDQSTNAHEAASLGNTLDRKILVSMGFWWTMASVPLRAGPHCDKKKSIVVRLRHVDHSLWLSKLGWGQTWARGLGWMRFPWRRSCHCKSDRCYVTPVPTTTASIPQKLAEDMAPNYSRCRPKWWILRFYSSLTLRSTFLRFSETILDTGTMWEAIVLSAD